MRILLENSGYPLTNMGDLAMLQVAAVRLRNLWPSSLIQVITNAPDKLAKFCPEVTPLLSPSHSLWFHPIFKQLYDFMPSSLIQHFPEYEWNLQMRGFSLVRSLFLGKLKEKRIESFLAAVYSADLVVACGGGYINDVFNKKAFRSLGILGIATKLGKPTVMLGQGLGPLENPKLRAKARKVLSHVNLVTLREMRCGIPLLNSLNLSHIPVITTGDDAIELAYEARGTQLGNGIGINLRMSDYAKTDTKQVETIRLVLQNTANIKDVRLIPIPISQSQSNSDVTAIQKLLLGYDNASDGGKSLDTPLKVIEQVRQCRVVVTGSYHAAVFALSQGIPVIGLANSEYYIDKFMGLSDQFGNGCEVILLNDGQLQDNLKLAIDKAWISAQTVRPQLLESARKQIELGHNAYKKVYYIVESRNQNKIK